MLHPLAMPRALDAAATFAVSLSTFVAFAALAVVARSAAAAPVNPDISVIGDSRAVYSEAEDEVALELHEVEVSLVGALNPYASAAVTLGIHEGEGIDVEEAKLMLDRYFPAGFGLTAGKFLLDFGQLNPVHAHAYPFVGRPLPHESFFGEEGAKDAGVRLDWIAPAGASFRASVGAVRGDVLLGGHAHEEDALDEPPVEEESPEVGATGRLELFAEPSPGFSFLAGGSVLHGTFDPHEGAKATWFGPDLKLRFDLGPQSALVVNAEAILGSLEATEEAPAADPNGWFASADWRKSRRWNFGGFAESATERQDDTVRTNRFGVFAGLALLEETTLFRVVGRTTDPDGGESASEVILQALFGLGPHRAHRY